MERARALWLKFVLPGLVLACLGIWSVIALEAAGLISLERCQEATCSSAFAGGTAPNNF
jgi:hypothetical protein